MMKKILRFIIIGLFLLSARIVYVLSEFYFTRSPRMGYGEVIQGWTIACAILILAFVYNEKNGKEPKP